MDALKTAALSKANVHTGTYCPSSLRCPNLLLPVSSSTNSALHSRFLSTDTYQHGSGRGHFAEEEGRGQWANGNERDEAYFEGGG
jgi:hypothetical protein